MRQSLGTEPDAKLPELQGLGNGPASGRHDAEGCAVDLRNRTLPITSVVLKQPDKQKLANLSCTCAERRSAGLGAVAGKVLDHVIVLNESRLRRIRRERVVMRSALLG